LPRNHRPSGSAGGGVSRRGVLVGAAGVGALTVLPAAAARSGLGSSVSQRLGLASHASAGVGQVNIPPAIRSRQALLGSADTLSALPITQNGTTYNLAQELRWLDSSHFAVGRWDGTMSLFEFETAPFVGPLVTAAVNTPSSQGVQMITPMPRMTIATSNNSSSFLLWAASSSDWAKLRLVGTIPYSSSLGVATNGAWFPVGQPSTLVIGHDSGYISLWSFDPTSRSVHLRQTINLQNPIPVNPFGSHVMYGMCPLISSGPNATVVAGSDDGYVSLVRVPSGTVVSQTVFNPAAQRGINSVSAAGNGLLVSNCSVGASDYNLWFFSVNPTTGQLTLLDRANLIVDTGRVQVFNFDTIWGQYAGGPCWFAGTEEGLLWMGTADSSLHIIGNQSLDDGAIGAALDYTGGPGRLAATIHNLEQFSTGGA
jgi:hypothetical protein